MSTLYIRLPSKAAADSAEHWLGLRCPFAIVSSGGAIEREGASPLSDLGEPVARAQRVVLLVAASDVSLLRVRVPPMSAAKLRAALPNLVEDQLIADPADCVVVAGATADGLRTVAVVERAWLEVLARSVTSLGARQVAALPAQLCLPWQEGGVAAAATLHGADIDLALRLTEQDGIGLPILPEAGQNAAQETLQALLAVVPTAPVTLYVPQAAVPAFQDALLDTAGAGERISVFADNWSRWISGAHHQSLDLLAGQSGARGAKLDWRRWRWPLALGAAVLLVNVLGANIEWLRMKREADTLRASLTQIYKTAYPKETVIVDPVAQMRQKIAAARHGSGQASPEDFTMMAAAFGEAWSGITQSQAGGKTVPALAGLEYRERSLLVRLKAEGEAPTAQMKSALAARDLALTLGPPQAGTVVWQIRSAK